MFSLHVMLEGVEYRGLTDGGEAHKGDDEVAICLIARPFFEGRKELCAAKDG